MEIENKKVTAVLLTFAALIGAVGITFFATKSSKPSVIPRIALPMPKDNIKPPKEFLSGYEDYQRIAGELKILGDSLNAAVPDGYVFDPPTYSFKPRPVAPPIVPPPTPAPTPANAQPAQPPKK